MGRQHVAVPELVSLLQQFHLNNMLSTDYLMCFHTEILVVCLFLSLHVQQTVSVPQLGHALRTHGDLGVLAVRHQSVADALTAAGAAGIAGTTDCTRGT